MLKILNTSQIKELDAYTIQHEPVESIDLMERACKAFCSWFTQHIDETKRIGIVCGTGNNGGDGLGIARILKEWGYGVNVWIVRGLVPESSDFKKNLSRLKGQAEIKEIISECDKGSFSNCDVLIDAIFGSGLSRAPEGIYAQVIQCMNQADAMRVAVDIPSGLMADKLSEGVIFNAHRTITFQLPKLSFFLPENYSFVGEWNTVDIGLDAEFIKKSSTKNFLLTRRAVRKILKRRSKFDHKGKFGHALLIAGSYGKMGAAILAARAALRSGLGLLTVHTPRLGYPVMQTAVPEAMTTIDADEKHFSTIPDLKPFDVIGIGPGIGQEKQTVKALTELLERNKTPLVLDADALNILGSNRDLLLKIPPGSVLTPHPGEFERLVGPWKNGFERLEKQLELSSRLKSVVIVKGAHSAISTPDGVMYFNNTGNPGMAKGGSGDVLAGLVTALLARGYTPDEASQLGCWVHGLAGDLALREKGMEGIIASDLIDHLPLAIKGLA